MNRTGVSLFLSSALHIALLSAFAMIPSNEKPVVHNMDLRITLQTVQRPASPGPSEPAAAEDTPVQDIVEAPIPVPDIKIEPVETPKPVPVKPVKETPKKPVEPPKKTTPKPKPAVKPPEIKPAAPQQSATQAAAPSNTTRQPSAATGKPPGTEKSLLAAPAPTPKILDAMSLKITKKVNPDYPMISRKRRDQGTVVLLIEITSGQVVAVELEKSSGHSPLDEAAIRAIRDWRFDMSGYGDHVTARIPFKFDLK